MMSGLTEFAYSIVQHRLCLRVMMRACCIRHGCWLLRDGKELLIRRKDRQIRISAEHLIYAQHTAKHFDDMFGLVRPTRVRDKWEADYSGPRLHVLSNGDPFELSSFPEEAEALDSYFLEFAPKPGDTAFDVGAYCGVFTKELSKRVGLQGRVIAFEPDPQNFALLERNVKRHALGNVTLVPSAISDKSGKARFNCEGALGSALSSSISRPTLSRVSTVETITLEHACQEYGLPSFVKIDAEGSEIEILSAAKDLLKRCQIHFALDTNHVRNGELTTARVERLFLETGYRAYSKPVSGYMTTWAAPESEWQDKEW